LPLRYDRSPHGAITHKCDGIQLSFFPYRKVLSFEFEYPLNTEPLRMEGGTISGNTNGHAVYFNSDSGSYYRDTTLNTGANISTSDLGNNWTP
jgi:hypothetical protein